MKILFVIAHLGKGGGQQIQAINLINEISKYHESQLVTLHYPSRIINAPCDIEYAGDLRFPQGIFDLRRYIKKHSENYEIIQVFDPYYGLPAVWLSKKRPYIIRLGMNPISDLTYRKKYISSSINRIILPQMLKSSTRVIVNSRHFIEEFASYDPVYIPNGYDFLSLLTKHSKDECRERLRFPKDKFILLFTGKVIPRKNLEVVLDVMKTHEEINFAIVGNTDEPLYGDRYYKKLCSEYKDIMDRVIFTGEIPMGEIKYTLGACDAYVFPSLLEGSPNSVLEAMVAGLPVVCSDIPPHKEIIEHGKNGMLFHERNELVDCISTLMDEGTTARSIGEAGRGYVTKHHNIGKVAEKYIALYQEILEGTAKTIF